MSKFWLAGISAIGLVTFGATLAGAKDVSTNKIQIVDNATPAKRKVLVQSTDAGVLLSEGDNPAANGASLHLYSATDDFCAVLPSGDDWKTSPKTIKFKDKGTKNSALIKDGKLQVKINSDVTYTLADNGTQGDVNALVQFGNGVRYCLRCSGNKKNDAKKFLGKGCVAAACAPEPSACPPVAPTTTTTTEAPTTSTTTTPASTTTTTTAPAGGTVLLGVLPATTGKFSYNLVPGIPGSDAACNTNFPGTHTCTYTELQAAEAAGDLVGIKDTTNASVTSFWAIDSTAAITNQCHDIPTDTVWNYQTAHTGNFGEQVALTNATGTLGPLKVGSADFVFCLNSSWVGCCH